MSLRLKINLIVALLMLAFTAAIMALQWRTTRAAVLEETVAANRVATQLLNRTAWLHASQGVATMQTYLEGMGRVRSNDIVLRDAEKHEMYRSPPSPYKVGRDAPAWFAALIAPPSSVQSIRFPGGELEVRSNASRAVLDAWDALGETVALAAALLLGMNALVFALVGRMVRPFGQIEQALQALEAGDLARRLPTLPGREAGAIGRAFNDMAGALGGRFEAERRATQAEIELSDSRTLARYIDQRIEQERQMIARELHDELGQSVTAMRSLALGIAQRSSTQDPQTEHAARVIADESSRLYDAMHGLIPRLAPLVLDSFGLADALRDLVERSRRSHPDVRVELALAWPGVGAGMRTDPPPLDTEAALALYRAAQEGLTNAIRHGQARHIALRLGTDAATRELVLTVVDDGRGLLPPAAGAAPGQGQGHYGLRWLAERLQALGGRHQLASAPGGGACLTVWLPIRDDTTVHADTAAPMIPATEPELRT